MIFYSILLVLTCFLFSLNTFLRGAKKQQIAIVLSWLIIAINCSSIYFFSIKFFLISVGITFITLWIVGFPARYIASKYWASRGSSIMPIDPDERMQWSMDIMEKARKKSEENNKTEYVRSPKDVVKRNDAFSKFMTVFMGSKKHSGMYYDNGQPVYGFSSTKNIAYYENSQKYSEMDIKDGKMHGKCIFYNSDGTTKTTSYYKNGQRIQSERTDFVKNPKNKKIVEAWDKAAKKRILERGEDIELICIKCETKRGNTAIKKCITCGWIFPD